MIVRKAQGQYGKELVIDAREECFSNTWLFHNLALKRLTYIDSHRKKQTRAVYKEVNTCILKNN
jgi:hypothetical protein